MHIPFLTRHVPEIYVIDIRYYKGSIAEFLSENEIKDVLFLLTHLLSLTKHLF